LMEDEERHRVGTRYKQAGQDSAIKLGHELVSGSTKDERVARWVQFASENPDGYLYCFRGGLRSRLSQQWLADAGIQYPRIVGGYKAMRSFLLEQLTQGIAQSQFILIAGFTGCGKTEVVKNLKATIDLEKLAQQITRIALEDESRLIGRCALPIPLREAMLASPVVWVEESHASRVERILHDYIEDLGAQFKNKLGPEAGFEAFSQRLLESLQNVYKRLGGERHARLQSLMQDALRIQAQSGDVGAHREWIRPLLTEYYDPMYEHQRAGKASRIIFSGDRMAVTHYLTQAGY
jgi:tRNA 2-selenouridine synthase